MAAEVHKSSQRAGLRAEMHERYTSYLLPHVPYQIYWIVYSQQSKGARGSSAGGVR